MDTTDLSGTVTVTFSTKEVEGSGGSSQPLVKEEFDTTTSDGVARPNTAIRHATATVAGEGTPTTSTQAGLPHVTATPAGGTGGDADIQCGMTESIGRAVDSGFTQLDCTATPGTTTSTVGTGDERTTSRARRRMRDVPRATSPYSRTPSDNYLSVSSTLRLYRPARRLQVVEITYN